MVEPLIGRSPFDFMLADVNLGLGTALYDAMGKYLDVPAYKLLGQKVRDAGAVAAWTRPCPAGVFAGEVQRAVDEGYRVFKMHTSPEYDPLRQAEAAADVAPDGFRLHYDFNGAGRSLGVLKPLVAEMERRHPIVGFIEDPLPRTDVEGWRRLRDQTTIPIVHGGGPALGGHYEMASGMADIFMLGGPIGDTVQRGIAAARANMQVIMQLTGGTLMKAMTLHLMAVLPTASAHSINLDDQYEEDITTERIPVSEGLSRVPEAPGLGIDVDEEMLKKVASNKQILGNRPRVIGILKLPGGTTYHTPRNPNPRIITGREEGTIRGIDFDRWEDDGSEEFEAAYQKMKAEWEAKGVRVTD
jgi:L-alanine-DL-glutamate epimerase-like enolase superfamily enzyme